MPGKLMAAGRRPEPCMPIPIWPKRTRSLAGTAFALRASGSSSTVLAAIRPPAAMALFWKNSRREELFFITISLGRNYGTFANSKSALDVLIESERRSEADVVAGRIAGERPLEEKEHVLVGGVD